jgi:hypothetical protein
MNEFFEELAKTKENIASIKITIDEIRSIHDRTLNNVTSEKENTGISIFVLLIIRNCERIGCCNG